MTTLSTPAITPASNVHDSTNATQSANVAASARAAFTLAQSEESASAANTVKANDAQRTAAIAKLMQASADTPDAASMLSTLAVVNAGLGSVPATLAKMSDIAVASGSGTLSDADRSLLQSQYGQLSQQVTSAVGSLGAGAQTSSHHGGGDSNADSNSQSSDDRRSTLTRIVAQAPQIVRHEPVEHLVTTTKMVQVAENTGERAMPGVVVHTHELHVGTDSYEPVAVKQTQMRLSRPATFAQVEAQTTTHRVAVAQVTQIVQMSQVAQVQQLSVFV
jgi:hypothetical protein